MRICVGVLEPAYQGKRIQCIASSGMSECASIRPGTETAIELRKEQTVNMLDLAGTWWTAVIVLSTAILGAGLGYGMWA